MRAVSSYLFGQWVEGTGEERPIVDPTTGATLAVVRDGGLDLGGALVWGRERGAALRAMTFAQRGSMLRGLSGAVHAARDELFDIARVDSGNTRSDAKFDVDGASGTLAYYAALGERLGERTLLVDGEDEPVGRSKRFVGRHLFVPREGIAIHLNAFNFPAWGLCEKLAVALLAGVPVLAKPSWETALVAVRIVELWAEAGLLPEGALQLFVGEPRDLLDHVRSQDVVAFTGSRATGRLVKSHPAVLRTGARVGVEADSLNAAVVGPDVAPGEETFELLVNDVARDLTQKAGQKCTALRRIVVPTGLVEPLVEALSSRLGDAVLGDPVARETTVGPLAASRHQKNALAGIAELARTAERVIGDPDAVPAEGCFVAPQVFVDRRGALAPRVHDHEIFGPVATLLPYDGDAAEAIRIVTRGDGGLVCAVYSDDLDWAGPVVRGLLSWHGRVVWGSKKVADQGVGPGTVLPNAVHGGPGAAGDGEELGGPRGLEFYWQRVALQADKLLMDRILGA